MTSQEKRHLLVLLIMEEQHLVYDQAQASVADLFKLNPRVFFLCLCQWSLWYIVSAAVQPYLRCQISATFQDH